jgi:hypothetical protein
MNSNNFSSSNNNLQSITSNDRFKPFFKASPENPSATQGQLSYHEELKINITRSESSGRQIFSKSMEYSLGVKFESSYEFKVPSPKDVASTVLGFVENRINAEKSSGASNERLNNLMEQAKLGIDKGYAQAEKDIKDLGLMTDELAKDIAEGYGLINKGLDNINQDINNPVVAKNEKISDPTKEGGVSSKISSDIFSRSDEIKSSNVMRNEDLKTASSIKQLTENTADFVLNTREGDQILIRMSDIQKLGYDKNTSGESLDVIRSSGFEFSVNGDLNDEELQAINDVLAQVGNISSLFFSDQFEEAFSSALSLGFDSSQIASFSLDLSKLQVQEVRTYEQSSKTALDSYKRYQPLINMAQQFEHLNSLLQPLDRFEKINSIVEALVDKAIDRYSLNDSKEVSGVNERVDGFKELSKKLMESLLVAEDQ